MFLDGALGYCSWPLDIGLIGFIRVPGYGGAKTGHPYPEDDDPVYPVRICLGSDILGYTGRASLESLRERGRRARLVMTRA